LYFAPVNLTFFQGYFLPLVAGSGNLYFFIFFLKILLKIIPSEEVLLQDKGLNISEILSVRNFYSGIL
jgi:hypothetical protein